MAIDPLAGIYAFDPRRGSALALRDTSMTWQQFMGIPQEGPQTYRDPVSAARAPADEAFVYACVKRLYQSAQGVPLRVYVRVGKDLIPATDEPSAEGDDLQALLDNFNPVDMTGTDARAYTMAADAVWGEVFWKKVRGRFGGVPQELYWLRAPDIEIDSANGRTPLAFKHHPPKGTHEVIAPRDMVFFRTPNLENPLRGLSPLSAVRNEIMTGRTWAERTSAGVLNDSVPPGYWQIPKDAEFTPQDQNVVRRALRALRGPRNKGRVPIMPAGMEFKGISLTPQDAEMVATRKLSRMAVCAALGVPLVLAGDDEKTTVYANLRDAERVFWRSTMIPKLDGFAGTLNNWLVPDFDPTRRRLVIAFDYSEVEALRPAWDVEMNTWINLMGSQAIVPNELRRHFRLGPDVPWGDKPTPRMQVTLRPDPAAIPLALIPASDPANVIELEQPEGIISGGEDATDVPESLRSVGAALYRIPAVKAWIAQPDKPLDTKTLLGGSIDDATRQAIEAGLRRRDSAAAIAARLQEVAA